MGVLADRLRNYVVAPRADLAEIADAVEALEAQVVVNRAVGGALRRRLEHVQDRGWTPDMCNDPHHVHE